MSFTYLISTRDPSITAKDIPDLIEKCCSQPRPLTETDKPGIWRVELDKEEAQSLINLGFFVRLAQKQLSH